VEANGQPKMSSGFLLYQAKETSAVIIGSRYRRSKHVTFTGRSPIVRQNTDGP
jgi:hypothetical protein